MGKWQYGDEGSEYDVQPGQIWRVGGHYFACRDIEAESGAIHMDSPHVVYVDPPWNAGNVKSFRTKAGVSRKVDFYGEFLPALIRQVKYCKGSVFCEAGNREVESVKKVFEEHGAKVLDHWPITYYRKNPCSLIRVSWGGDDGFSWDLSGFDDENTPDEVLRWYSGEKYILDPCMGRGLTALAAAKYGFTFRGVELHPRRMAIAMSRVAKKISIQPQKIGAYIQC